MISLQEIYQYLDQVLNGTSFEDYCPNGLQVQGKQVVGKIGTAVTASLATIAEAAKQEVDCLIVHHGLFWNGDPYPLTGVKKKKIDLLVKHDISLIAYHLPLDAHREYGNNWKAAKDLNWNALEPFGLLNGVPIGVRGVVDPIDRESLSAQLADYYQHPCHSAFGGPEMIETLALVSGGAHKLLPDAAKEGIDCFITGTVDEPVWHWAHEEGINFMAFGHSATEKVGVGALCHHLQGVFSLPTVFLDDANPF